MDLKTHDTLIVSMRVSRPSDSKEYMSNLRRLFFPSVNILCVTTPDDTARLHSSERCAYVSEACGAENVPFF